MNSDAKSKLPLPSEVSDFRFLRSDRAPGYAVLELDTATNPVRVFLSREQIEQLKRDAGITLAEIASDEVISRERSKVGKLGPSVPIIGLLVVGSGGTREELGTVQ